MKRNKIIKFRDDIKKMRTAFLILAVIVLAYFGYRYMLTHNRGFIGISQNGSALYSKAPTSLPLRFVVDFRESNIKYWENDGAVGGSYLTLKTTAELMNMYEETIVSTGWKGRHISSSGTGASISFYDPKRPDRVGQIDIVSGQQPFSSEVYFRLAK